MEVIEFVGEVFRSEDTKRVFFVVLGVTPQWETQYISG
jgi:hypothetical protein